MRPILTVTLNPALDLDTSTPEVVPGPKLRCAQPRIDPGGGGVNVSRAIRILGGDSRCAVAVGGAIGALLVELLRAEGIDPVGIPVAGLTRQSLAVRSEATGEHYRFVLPGPMWDEAQAEAAFARIEALATPGTLLVASGSLPPGLARDTWLRLDDRTAAHGAETILDTSGAALAATLVPRARPLFLLRVDRREAMELAGDSLQGISALAAFARWRPSLARWSSAASPGSSASPAAPRARSWPRPTTSSSVARQRSRCSAQSAPGTASSPASPCPSPGASRCARPAAPAPPPPPPR